VLHHRHHAADAITGAALGAATSAVFFLWQERRFRRADGRPPRGESLQVGPSFDRLGVTLRGAF
jgi:hypothetical protein